MLGTGRLAVLTLLSVTVVWQKGTWHLFGFPSGTAPFADLGFVLAALECTRLGIDVTVVNPCDIASRRFICPPAWLALSPLPLDQDDTVWLGLLLIAAYATVAAYVLQPKNRSAWLVGVALLISPSSMYLMERGSVDALLFLVLTAGLTLAFRQRMDLFALPQDPRNVYPFACGAGILISCFLTAVNVPYWAVFVILTVPYLIGLARTAKT